MSIQSEINRIKTDKESLITNLKEKGVQIADGATLGDISLNVKEIEIGTDTSDATATANDILSGKTAYVKGTKITGNINTVIQATPSVTVNSNGLITAKATQSAGYVNAGSKNGTKQLTTQAAKTIIPSTSNQTAVASGRYTTGTITVKGDSNLKAENIAEGISIFGVTGTHSGGGGGSSQSGFSVTFPNANSNYMNWSNLAVAYILKSDGTVLDIKDQNVVAGKTIDGVVLFTAGTNQKYWGLRFTFKGKVAFYRPYLYDNPSLMYQVSNDTTITNTIASAIHTNQFFIPASDLTISAIFAYNTD